MHEDMNQEYEANRRGFLRSLLRTLAGVSMAGGALAALRRPNPETVWQLDPEACVQCGRCATHCVLSPSAVKCVHAYDLCGYCDLCGGYFRASAAALNTGAENQLCPTGAIIRTFIEDPYYEYSIDVERCIGCGVCVKGCGVFGNGSLFLQVMHDRCVGCNDCAIARACPAQAFRRIPASDPYILRGRDWREADGES